MAIYDRWKCPTLEAPIPISLLGRTPRWGQGGSSWTHASGFHSYESVYLDIHACLKAPGLEWDSYPSHELHKHTGAEILLPKLNCAQQRGLHMSSWSTLPLQSQEGEGGSQLAGDTW